MKEQGTTDPLWLRLAVWVQNMDDEWSYLTQLAPSIPRTRRCVLDGFKCG